MTSNPISGGSTKSNWSQQEHQQQNHNHNLSEKKKKKPNGNGFERSSLSLTPFSSSNSNSNSNPNPYPPPTALYLDLTRDANLFWEKLQSFHTSFGTKYKVPTIGGRPLDLYRLFVEVTSRGGLEKVITDRKWKEVILAFKFRETITSASFMVRRYYLSLLYHFEQVYYFRRQGPPSSTDALNRNLDNSSTTVREGAAMNDLAVQVSPAQTIGSVLPGTIDGKFDGGYVVTVNLGSERLKGILYHVADNVSQSSHAESKHSSQSRKRGRLAMRDPSRPKSNRSGYNFFFAEHYASLRPSFHGQERAISKRIGLLWNNLTEAQRQVYQEKGMRDKERYRSEMLEYKSSNSTPQ